MSFFNPNQQIGGNKADRGEYPKFSKMIQKSRAIEQTSTFFYTQQEVGKPPTVGRCPWPPPTTTQQNANLQTHLLTGPLLIQINPHRNIYGASTRGDHPVGHTRGVLCAAGDASRWEDLTNYQERLEPRLMVHCSQSYLFRVLLAVKMGFTPRHVPKEQLSPAAANTCKIARCLNPNS